jgi:predicted DNA-binding transcriptional regulator AlpA
MEHFWIYTISQKSGNFPKVIKIFSEIIGYCISKIMDYFEHHKMHQKSEFIKM